jgi:hypothetical protein
MKKVNYILLCCFSLIILLSCQNKTVDLLSKRWDYEKIENVDTINRKFVSVEDSVANANMEMAMKLLSWTFKKNMDYECTVGNHVATQGTYKLSEHDKVLTMTPSTKNNINNYAINVLTENELVLSGLADGVTVTLHFRAHD